jgi:hypothetical protein
VLKNTLPNSSTIQDKTYYNKNQGRYDAPASGAWKITGLTIVDPASAVVDVGIKNSTYYHKDQINRRVIIPNLNSRYFFQVSTTPGAYDLYVYTYVSVVGVAEDENKASSFPPVLTPGYSDPSTRFSVTIYG